MWFTNYVTYQINLKWTLNTDLILNIYVRWKRLRSNMRDMTIIQFWWWTSTFSHTNRASVPFAGLLSLTAQTVSSHLPLGRCLNLIQTLLTALYTIWSVYSKTFILISSFCDSWELYSGTLLLARRPCKDCTYYEKDESSYDSKNALKIFNITCWARNKNKLTGSGIMAKSSEYKLNHLENTRVRYIYNTDQKESYASQHIHF